MKLYKRAIELFWQSKTNKGWKYMYTTNAFRTCREAVADTKVTWPDLSIKGNFAKKMSETKMSDYIKGFNAGVDCVLNEIERLEKIAPINLEQLLKHLDPQRDQKTAQKPEKTPS